MAHLRQGEGGIPGRYNDSDEVVLMSAERDVLLQSLPSGRDKKVNKNN